MEDFNLSIPGERHHQNRGKTPLPAADRCLNNSPTGIIQHGQSNIPAIIKIITTL